MAKVMLVEDDNNLREIYEARLQAEGYNIVTARDGEEALVVAKAEKPDLIISDVMMPKISGFEMLDILRNTDGLKEVKVIMLTALGQNDDQQRADRLGADRYLVKSQVTLEDIVKVTHELLGDTPAAAADPPAVGPPPADPAPNSPAPSAPDPMATPPADPAPAPPSAPTAAPPSDNSTNITVNVPDDSGAAATSTAEEKATVEGEIDDFVAGANPVPDSASAPVVAQPDPMATPAADPVVPAPTNPAAAVSAPPAQVDDKLLADAVQDLNSDTETGNATAAPPAAGTTPSDAAADADTPVAATGGKSSGGSLSPQKVIKPLDSEPKKDLDTLLAIENAKEDATEVMSPADPSIDPNNIAL